MSMHSPETSRRGFITGACAAAGLGAAAAVAGAQEAPIAEAGNAQAAVATQPWAARRQEIVDGWLSLLGPFPEQKPELAPEMRRVDDIDGIECHYVTYQTEPGERVPGYLLVPARAHEAPCPTVMTVHPTTPGAGKRRTVGLSGGTKDDPPDPPETSRAYGLELARWGYVTFTIDLMCDGERVPEGAGRYDTRAFYQRHPEWSAVGKNIWDLMRGIDFLETLDFVDASRIACAGHSLGGHMSLFTAAFDARVAAAVCNGGVYSWRRDEDHWSRPERADGAAVESYIYIKRFRPYIEDQTLPIPADFDELMMLVAPRPLLLMQTEGEFARDDTVEKAARAAEAYRTLGAGEKIGLFNYPGDHNYPPVAKRYSFAWLDRWFGHTPATPSIWPGVAL